MTSTNSFQNQRPHKKQVCVLGNRFSKCAPTLCQINRVHRITFSTDLICTAVKYLQPGTFVKLLTVFIFSGDGACLEIAQMT